MIRATFKGHGQTLFTTSDKVPRSDQPIGIVSESTAYSLLLEWSGPTDLKQTVGQVRTKLCIKLDGQSAEESLRYLQSVVAQAQPDHRLVKLSNLEQAGAPQVTINGGKAFIGSFDWYPKDTPTILLIFAQKMLLDGKSARTIKLFMESSKMSTGQPLSRSYGRFKVYVYRTGSFARRSREKKALAKQVVE